MSVRMLGMVAQIFAAFVGLLVVAKGSVVEQFFRWIMLGFLLDFIYLHYAIIMAVLATVILLQWIRNPKILIAIFLLVWFFMAKVVGGI